MQKFTFPTLLLTSLFQVQLFAIDLTPHEAAPGNAGHIARRYYFQDGGKQLTFRVDSRMSPTGGGDAVEFRLEDVTGAAVKLGHSAIAPAVAFDEKNLPAYRAAARALVPANATDLQSGEDLPNPIAINGWTSYQFNFTYRLFGFDQRRSVTFINYNDHEQLVFTVGASAADYEKVYTRGYRILNSLTDAPFDPNGPT